MLFSTAFRAVSIVVLALFTATTARADATVNWQSTTETLAREVLDRSNIVADFTSLVSKHFKITLRVTVNDDLVPHVNADNKEITLPYRYLTHAISSHAELEETQQAALDRALDTVEYTLYHLFGHLLITDNSADADDFAEAISSWLMIKAYANGGEQWFNDAEAFGRASQLLDGPLEDYWHEHSLYKSRNRVINCWILGSAPDKYNDLLTPVLEPHERTTRCKREWQLLNSRMQALLKDKLNAKSTLLTN